MRYVRFLKTPRVVVEKGTSRKQIQCLITITSDLGDSFLPEDVQLVAEVLTPGRENGDGEEVKLWQTVQWKGGMRTLSVAFPLPKSLLATTLLVKIGSERMSKADDYMKLRKGRRGVVSAWSAEFDPSSSSPEAEKLVQRRLYCGDGRHKDVEYPLKIWEETGESIARHLWDAGIVLSCHLHDFQGTNMRFNMIRKALFESRPDMSSPRHILELGTGCGIVGISLAQGWTREGVQIILTDLPEAQEIVQRNLAALWGVKHAAVHFQELNWDDELPDNIQNIDLILAADCTYNPDSSPALVNTFSRVAAKSTNIKIGVAMKTRHESEAVFFDLMAVAGFMETAKIEFPLPGDAEEGEEVVNLHFFEPESERTSR